MTRTISTASATRRTLLLSMATAMIASCGRRGEPLPPMPADATSGEPLPLPRQYPSPDDEIY